LKYNQYNVIPYYYTFIYFNISDSIFQLINYLYSVHPNNVFVTDVVSLDIQQSRDHGIPSYTEFRKYCPLKAIRSEHNLSQIMVKSVSLKIFEILNNNKVVILFLYIIIFSQLIDY